MSADAVNAAFEALGAVAIGLSIRRLAKDKTVSGVSPWMVAFFFSWGIWNLHFYGPATGNWLSWRAGWLVAAANLVYVLQLLWYKSFPGGLTIDRLMEAMLAQVEITGQVGIDTSSVRSQFADAVARQRERRKEILS